MPTFRSLQVIVTDENGVPLQEFGTNKRDSSKIASCFIQSKTNMKVRICVRAPTLPSPVSRRPEDDIPAPGVSGGHSAPHPALPASGDVSNPGCDPFQSPAPWHLLVTVRFDGKKSFERRNIMYLDRAHSDHVSSSAETVMNSGVIWKAGQWRECEWVFKEVNFDMPGALDKLSLAGDANTQKIAVTSYEDDLASAVDGLKGTTLDNAKENMKAGQIKVSFKRVTVGGTYERLRDEPTSEQDFHTHSSSDSMERRDHAVGHDDGVYESDTAIKISFEPYIKGEPAFATFKFYYRGEATLRKYDFKGFPKAPQSAQQTARNALTQAAAQPLSNKKRSMEDEDDSDEDKLTNGAWESPGLVNREDSGASGGAGGAMKSLAIRKKPRVME